jgi:hypothetical protein
MPQRTIFTQDVLRALASNGRWNRSRIDRDETPTDFKPVVKIFNPYGGATWLLTESDPDESDRLFGLCDLGQGFPELGYVSRSEIETCRIRRGGYELPLERDKYFKATHTLSVYAEAARACRRITEDRAALGRAQAATSGDASLEQSHG